MLLWAVLLWSALLLSAFASPNADSLPISLDLPNTTVGATLLLPRVNHPVPCIVLAGGTLSQLRDGDLLRPNTPPRKALKRLAESLAGAGYASLRYDQPGHGESRTKPSWVDLYQSDAKVLASLYQYLRARPECSSVVAAAESAGAYIASLAARDGAHADAYLFLGGFCGKAEEIFSYNHGRLAEYAAASPANAAWAKAHRLDRYLAYGRQWPQMFAAAKARQASWELRDGAVHETVALARRTEELDLPPDDMFAHIQRPALALAGTRDRNVPPHHAACAVAIMQRAGNLQTQSALIDGADHNFQIAPEDPGTAIRERFTFSSFENAYHPDLDRTILAWLRQYAPLPGQPQEISSAPVTLSSAEPLRAVQAPEREPATAVSPERLHLAPGLTLIDDILDKSKTPGVDTLEGRIGPLLRVPGMRAHFIDMPAGLYLDEHPHTKGSLIYTARGSWALRSFGRWHLMKPGSLYWFGDNIPTGFQVPFPEDAYILIFKAIPGDDDQAFVTYLQGMAANLRKDQANGTPFRLVDLPPNHPALDFARSVNPSFNTQFPRKRP
ncbi:MAG: alpha/beta hydrolase [Bryobacterales bacterium]|nr:alpha/beta hydrolase [Bryobacterales bacterium]